MGCSFARSLNSEINAHVFRVYNVDERGSELSPGKIEIGDTDLILYQKGKEPIIWPLRCLRRYGFDAELFSFESGRRCPTGPGIYAFKCRNAEALFNMVQECILRAGQEDHTRVSHNIFTGSSRPNSRPHSLTETHETYGIMVNGRNNSFSGSLGNAQLYVNGDIVQRNSHEYINTNTGGLSNGLDQTSALIDFLHNPNLAPSQEPQVNYAELDLPRSTENLCEENNRAGGRLVSETNSTGGLGVVSEDVVLVSMDSDVFLEGLSEAAACPEYINIAPEGAQGGAGARDSTILKRDHNYANLTLNGEVIANNNNEDTLVNYIQLDLKNQTSDNPSPCQSISPTSPVSFSSLPESPSKKTESYAMIDFDRMAALTRKNNDQAAGPNDRKTRHNSTIGDIM
ncbi:fibroblast growth factor receptor substrate 2 [Patella vulgata]|uniref:fibroblast growth factor receptor substrate 2 n=1 Tax=Patella vulgata TaxID=6465 RepID=UPI0024A970B2|nr:fibroblast growth factor receptor substrate 2 [Patella vulgata]